VIKCCKKILQLIPERGSSDATPPVKLLRSA
jgi:hypothetical protein